MDLKSLALAVTLLATLFLPGCAAPDPKEAAARAWERSECDRVLDHDDRERCLKRVDR
jgi:hypothetical protein